MLGLVNVDPVVLEDAPQPPVQDEILRFHQAERRLHWAIAVPFMVCYATALVLVFVYNLHPERPLRLLVSWVHRLSALSLILLPPLVLLTHRGDARLYWQNVQDAWRWTLDDLKWLVLMGPASINKSIALPHQGKFNAAEKINFLSLLATYPMFVLTGLTIWLSSGSYLAWLAHIAIALWCTPLMFGHIFMATVNPETRVGLSGMITGYVDRSWARHHYRLWYDRHHGIEATAPVEDLDDTTNELEAAEPGTAPLVAARDPQVLLPSADSWLDMGADDVSAAATPDTLTA